MYQKGDKITIKNLTFHVVGVRGSWVALGFENHGVMNVRFVKIQKMMQVLKVG